MKTQDTSQAIDVHCTYDKHRHGTVNDNEYCGFLVILENNIIFHNLFHYLE